MNIIKTVFAGIVTATIVAIGVSQVPYISNSMISLLGGVTQDEHEALKNKDFTSSLRQGYFYRGYFSMNRATCMKNVVEVLEKHGGEVQTFKNNNAWTHMFKGKRNEVLLKLYCMRLWPYEDREPTFVVFGTTSTLNGDSNFYWGQLREEVTQKFAPFKISSEHHKF